MKHTDNSRGGEATILIVCTGNRGRSPTAEAMLRQMLRRIGLGDRIHVHSAGLCSYELNRVGLPADETVIAIAARHGLDLSNHVVRPLNLGMVEQAALIIVMEGWQARVLRTACRNQRLNVLTLRELEGHTDDLDTPDIAGLATEDVEGFVEGFCAEAERCLSAGLRAGPLAEVVDACR